MANRRFEQFQYTLEKKVVTLYMNVAIGASGAPTLTASLTVNGLTRGLNKGILSMVRNSAGKYTISYGSPSTATQAAQPDLYYALLDFGVTFLSGASAPAAAEFNVVADNSSTGSVQIQFRNNSGTATDPANGEVLLMAITLSNSGV